MPYLRIAISLMSYLLSGALVVRADIYEWEYINPANPGMGKQESTTLVPDGAGVDALPGASLGFRNLTMAYLSGKDLTAANLGQANLSNANLSNATLVDVQLQQTVLNGADLTGADILKTQLAYATENGFTASQLYSTASYQNKQLVGIWFFLNDLCGWNFSGQNLSMARFTTSALTNSDFSDAIVLGTDFNQTTDHGFTAAQLYATASYEAKDLRGIKLSSNDLTGWDFSDQNLESAEFYAAQLTNTNFSGANIRYAGMANSTNSGLSDSQLYSTASYQEQDIRGINLNYSKLTNWNFAGQNLSEANFENAELTNVDFSDAVIENVYFYSTTDSGFTASQLYSTASYQARDLTGVNFAENDLSGWNFSEQTLRGAKFYSSNLSNADFTDADIRGTDFHNATSHGLSRSQIYSTVSYKTKDLSDTLLPACNLGGWDFQGFDLSNTYLGGAFLWGTDFSEANLSYANLYNANVKHASFRNANLSFVKLRSLDYLIDADLTGAEIRGADLSGSGNSTFGFTVAQIYSTASYQAKDLTGIKFDNNVLAGMDLSEQNLTAVSFNRTGLSNADLTDAIITGVDLTETTRWFKSSQLYSTRNYKTKDLQGIIFDENTLHGWDFQGQNLTNASFADATFERTHFESADLRGAKNVNLKNYTGQVPKVYTSNLIRPDGTIGGLNLGADGSLLIRDYDGNPIAYPTPLGPIAITVQDQFNMRNGGTLELQFEADQWDSLISFDPGIPVNRGGTLKLDFTPDVDIPSQIGRSLQIFDWTGVSPTGTFSIESPYGWDLSSLYTTGEITLLAELLVPGDFDRDRDVDGADFLAWQHDPNVGSLTTWQANYGGLASPPSPFGDFDSDGDVDGNDFLVWQRNPSVGALALWQANFGNPPMSLTTASSAVPEPSGVLLAGLVLLVGVLSRSFT